MTLRFPAIKADASRKLHKIIMNIATLGVGCATISGCIPYVSNEHLSRNDFDQVVRNTHGVIEEKLSRAGQDKLLAHFPIGTPVQDIKTYIIESGGVCVDGDRGIKCSYTNEHRVYRADYVIPILSFKVVILWTVSVVSADGRIAALTVTVDSIPPERKYMPPGRG